MTRIRLLEFGIARLRESKPQPWTFAPPHVDRHRRDEIEIVHMKPDDAQESRQLRKIAADHPLQVWHLATAPVIEVFRREQTHLDQNIDGRDNLPALQNRCNGALDSRIEPVFTMAGDGDHRFRRPYCVLRSVGVLVSS